MMTGASHYLLIGLGKIGQQVANGLAQQQKNVTAVSRSYKTSVNEAVNQIQADARFLTLKTLGMDVAEPNITHMVIIVSPDGSTEQAYRESYFDICQTMVNLARQLPKLQRVVYISSTGVYGQNNGEVIDSDSPIQPPTAATSQVLLDTERLWQQHFEDKCTIIRASGIYGKQRTRLITIADRLATGDMPPPSNTWTNRIFDTDLVQVIVHALNEDKPLAVYLATDFEPAPMYHVLEGIAEQRGISLTLPRDIPKTGKRIISNLPKNWLNYPSWQHGYHAILH